MLAYPMSVSVDGFTECGRPEAGDRMRGSSVSC